MAKDASKNPVKLGNSAPQSNPIEPAASHEENKVKLIHAVREIASSSSLRHFRFVSKKRQRRKKAQRPQASRWVGEGGGREGK